MKTFDVYAAIFTYADDGITVTFPDFETLVAEGDTEEEAYISAQDALEGYIAFKYKGSTPPVPTSAGQLLAAGNFDQDKRMQLIRVSGEKVNAILQKKHVRRNITIPKYIDDAAKLANLNVSEIAATALKQSLKIA